ncbi:MAG: hypothetical protein R8G66_32375 [Cytophagales bacterium]|nr:hypothetical protein [Cytophagales bacterium]
MNSIKNWRILVLQNAYLCIILSTVLLSCNEQVPTIYSDVDSEVVYIDEEGNAIIVQLRNNIE